MNSYTELNIKETGLSSIIEDSLEWEGRTLLVRREFLRDKPGWKSVTVQNEFNEMDGLSRLIPWLQKNGASYFYAVNMDNPSAMKPSFKINADLNSFREFTYDYGPMDLMLLDSSCRFLILHFSDGISQLCGPREFIEEIIGASIYRARLVFRQFIFGADIHTDNLLTLKEEMCRQDKMFEISNRYGD